MTDPLRAPACHYVLAVATSALILFAAGPAAAHADHGTLDTNTIEEDAGDVASSDVGGDADTGRAPRGDATVGPSLCTITDGGGSAPVSGALVFLGVLALRSRNG